MKLRGELLAGDSGYTTGIPDMPGAYELLGLVVAIFIIWVLLKVARVAIKLFVMMIIILAILAATYWVFMR